jgi:predicted nucleic-acid-binding Zn-ribbon protein
LLRQYEERQIRYVVIAEEEEIGFITRNFASLAQAREYAEQLFDMAHENHQYYLNKLINYLDELQFCTYTIKGNGSYFSNAIYCSSNGFLTVYVIECEMSEMYFRTFIRERENFSMILDIDALRKYVPELSRVPLLIAN